MPTRAVALLLVLSLPAAAQPRAEWLPSPPPPPAAIADEGDPSEHSFSWQLLGTFEGVVTGALLFSLLTIAATNKTILSSQYTVDDNLRLASATGVGAALFGAGGTWLGARAQDDDGPAEAARHVIRWHTILLGTSATVVTMLAAAVAIIVASLHSEPLTSH